MKGRVLSERLGPNHSPPLPPKVPMVLTSKRWEEWKMDKVINELVSILREFLKLKKAVWKGEEVDPKYFNDLTNLLDRCEQRGLTGEFNDDKLNRCINFS
jgi:hypothetical protein